MAATPLMLWRIVLVEKTFLEAEEAEEEGDQKEQEEQEVLNIERL